MRHQGVRDHAANWPHTGWPIGRTGWGAGVVVAGIAAALALWAVLVHLVGVELELGRAEPSGTVSAVGAVDVLVASLAAGMGAWAVAGLLVRRRRAQRRWVWVATTALSISVIAPSWLAEGAAAVSLIGMHLAVGGVLIAGFRRWVGSSRCACAELVPDERLALTGLGAAPGYARWPAPTAGGRRGSSPRASRRLRSR